MSAFNKAIELKPGFAKSYTGRGLAWGIKGNYDRAILDLNKAIKLNIGYADAYYSRAIVYKMLKQSRKAADDYNNYLRINGNKDGDADQVRQKIKTLGYTPKY